MVVAVSLCIALTWLAAPMVAQPADDWSRSAEASLMTRVVGRGWLRLDSAGAREAFKRAYWQRRDPTPDTAENEFQEEILARVRRADERFGSANVIGSQTARGVVFVVLGPPAVVRGTIGPLDTAPRSEFPGGNE